MAIFQVLSEGEWVKQCYSFKLALELYLIAKMYNIYPDNLNCIKSSTTCFKQSTPHTQYTTCRLISKMIVLFM